jgi:PAS domain S-box-containing protein
MKAPSKHQSEIHEDINADLILESIADAIIIINSQGEITQINKQTEMMFGYSSEELIGKKIDILLPDRFQHQHVNHRSNYFANPRQRPIGIGMDLFAQHKDGLEFPCEISLNPVTVGALHVICCIRDVSDQKSLEKRHEEDEHLMTEILDFLPQEIALIDETGNILAVNKAWRQFGIENNYTGSSFTIGCNYMETCDAAYDECADGEHNIADCIRDVLSGKVSQVRFEYACHSPDEQRWFQCRINRLIYDNQIRAVIAHENITEIKLEHEALMASEKKFRVVTESVSDLVWVAHTHSDVLEIYGDVDAMLKYEPGEYPRTITANIEHMHPDDRELVKKIIEHCIDTGEDYSAEYRIRCKDGSYRYWQDHGSWTDYEAGEATGSVKDVTEKKQAEAALLESEQRFRQYFELGLIGMAITSPEKEWLEFNDTLCDMLGYSRDEFASKTWAELTHPDDLEGDITAFNHVMSGKINGYTMAKRFIQKNGSILDAEISANAIRKPDGTVDYFVALIHDVTQIKEAEREASMHRERLAHLVRIQTLGEMATGIAHEINQPLAAIESYTQACQRHMQARKSNPDKVEELLDKISGQAKRAGSVVSRLRAMMQRRTVNPIKIDINALLEEIVKIAEIDTRHHNCRLILKLAPSNSIIIGDDIQIQQVVLNLIRNAIDAMEDLNDEKEKKITVESKRKGSNDVMISVTDKGKGISELDATNIFEAFYTTKDHGLGMGLAICKNIIDAHGGEIDCSKTTTGGTTMYFTLPTETQNG